MPIPINPANSRLSLSIKEIAMSAPNQDDLWRSFPRTAQEFDERFPDEESCRAHWIKARWSGHGRSGQGHP
jgi:hypothetical protein